MILPNLQTIHGVDFSGARNAGRTIWIARIERDDAEPAAWALTGLDHLEDLCGTAERDVALAFLVETIALSKDALWALDCPFGLPVELLESGAEWTDQLDLVGSWDAADARGFGLQCLQTARALGDQQHIRRLTDSETKTPFDAYHYRIIYQTFHGMRDVLDPLRRVGTTAILPFDYDRLPSARRVVIEACPSSTLKRLGLPYRNYKQAGNGPSDPSRLRTRRAILGAVGRHIRISRSHRYSIVRNNGGDALDAVIAALGALQAFQAADHDTIARHPRYPREGFIYA